MRRHTWVKRGLGLALLGCGLVGPAALAEERWLRTQVSVLATGREPGLDVSSDLLPWVNLGVALRTPGEAEAGWLFGTNLSFNLVQGTPRDNGSALFVRYRPERWSAGEDVSLTLYPLDSSRLRLGWAFPATWGGNFYGRWESTTRGWGPTHGVLLQVQRERWHAFAALKASNVTESLAPMVGAGVSLPLSLRAEVQAAHVERWRSTSYPGLFAPETGQLDPDLASDFDLIELLDDRTGKLPTMPYVQGVSARLVHARGEPIGNMVDFGLYGGAPTLFEEVLRPEPYPEGSSHSVSLEATHAIMSTLWGTAMRRTHTNMVALDARLRWNRLRLQGLGLVRGAGAVVLEDGYLWSEFTHGSRRRPELGASLGADYHLASLGLTPGLGVRVLRPAAHLRNENRTDRAPSWWRVSSGGMTRLSTPESGPLPDVSARASLKWNPVTWLSAVGEVSYTWERNAPALSGRQEDVYLLGTYVRERALDSAGLDFNLLVQARY